MSSSNNKKLIIILCSVLGAVIIALTVFITLYFSKKSNDSNTSQETTEQNTTENETEAASDLYDKYVGVWQIENSGEKELTISSIDSSSVSFSIWYYRIWSCDTIKAELKDNVAHFNTNEVEGTLTFGDNYIILDITNAKIPVISVCTEKYSVKTEQSSQDYNDFSEDYSDFSEGYDDFSEQQYSTSVSISNSDTHNTTEYNDTSYDDSQTPAGNNTTESISENITDSTTESITESTTESASDNTSTNSKQLSGVLIDDNIYGCGNEHTTELEGVTFHWYDRYELNPSFSNNDWIVAYDFDISSQLSFSWKCYDKDGYNLPDTHPGVEWLKGKARGKCSTSGFLLGRKTAYAEFFPFGL